MPPVRRAYQPKPVKEALERSKDAMEEVAQEDVQAFMSSMQRNAKGTLWKRFSCGTSVSVFRDQFGRNGYVVCIKEPDEPRYYLDAMFASEKEAIAALLESPSNHVFRLCAEGAAIDDEISWMK